MGWVIVCQLVDKIRMTAPDERFRNGRMTTTDVSEFPALQEAARILDALDGHRQRQACAFFAERYGWNLQPSAKKITFSPNTNNRSEFAAIEQIAELIDPLNADQQRQAVTFLGARYSWKMAAAYKPPGKGFAPRRKFSKG